VIIAIAALIGDIAALLSDIDEWLPPSGGRVAFAGFTAALLLLSPPQKDSQLSQLRELHHNAANLLDRAAAAQPGTSESNQLLDDAATQCESLAKAAVLPEDLRRQLHEAAGKLRKRDPNESASIDKLRELLKMVAARLDADPLADLAFQGSYSQTKVAEPVYGGHGTAMGPPPEMRNTADRNVASPVQFEEVRCLEVKTYCGGRTKDHILESGGSGVALLDFDGDGLLDVYVVNAFELSDKRERIPHKNALFRNLGGWKFQDVSAGSGVDLGAWGNGVCVGDYDDDGKLDMYVTNFGPNFLFHNNGNGRFTESSSKAGIQAGGWSTGCTFFDADGDGDLDLYVARYVTTSWNDLNSATRTLTWRGGPKTMIGPVGLPGEADLFFENRGDGTFVEATDTHGLTDAARAYGFGVVATDYDGDGWIDLYVANDTNPNFLYHNLGNGRFESVGLLSGVALNAEGRAQAGMGVDAGDYDGDGHLDLIVTNFAQDTNTLYHNRDGHLFEDVTTTAGLAGPTFVRMGWGTAFFDADLDGRLDLFFANGHIYPNVDDFPQLQETFRQKNQFFLNRGSRFVDVSESAGPGLQIAKSSRGLAVGDLDTDGDLDLVISNMDDVPTVLNNQQRTGQHWVGVHIEKSGRNRFCIGAQVTVTAGGVRQVREVRSGGSYLSQNDLRVFYGLGSYVGSVDVEVRMPGGRTWRWKDQPIDRLIELKLDDRESR